MYFLENYEKEKAKDSRKSYDQLNIEKVNENIPKMPQRKSIFVPIQKSQRSGEEIDYSNNLDDLRINNRINSKKNKEKKK